MSPPLVGAPSADDSTNDERRLADWLVKDGETRNDEHRRRTEREAAHPPSPQAPGLAVKPPGALALWREELRRRYRGQRAEHPATWRYDALWRAACWECKGGDLLREAFQARTREELRRWQASAEMCFQRAAAIIEEAAAQKVARSAA